MEGMFTVLLYCQIYFCVNVLPFYCFSARSPVFSAMFEHEMEESKKVSPRTQPVFILAYKLDFLLCGSAPHLFS